MKEKFNKSIFDLQLNMREIYHLGLEKQYCREIDKCLSSHVDTVNKSINQKRFDTDAGGDSDKSNAAA